MLIITGTMGAAKTTVMAEASGILALRHVVHAAIELDALRLAHLPSSARNDGVIYGNLDSVSKNYARPDGFQTESYSSQEIVAAPLIPLLV